MKPGKVVGAPDRPRNDARGHQRDGEGTRISRSAGRVLVGAAGATLVLAAPAAPALAHFLTERVSLGPGGVQGNGLSGGAAISADGRSVAFISFASNLVPGDTNGVEDVFVRVPLD